MKLQPPRGEEKEACHRGDQQGKEKISIKEGTNPLRIF